MVKTWKYSEPTVLASASPRRKELLAEICECFEILPADIDESATKALTPRGLVRKLSKAKALSVAALKDSGEKTVIGADTVVYRRKIYGKPRNRAEAIAMLSALNGKTHHVFTGVTVIKGGRVRTFSVKSAVKFRKLASEETERYVDEYEPYDKAGAYAIQEGVVVQSYKGSYSNIVGLPLERLARILKNTEV